MLKHEDRATGVLGAASRRQGADSEYLGGLLAAVQSVVASNPSIHSRLVKPYEAC